MITIILFILNFSFSQGLDNCDGKDKYKYEYFFYSLLGDGCEDLKVYLYTIEDNEIYIKFPSKNINKKITLKKGSVYSEVILLYQKSYGSMYNYYALGWNYTEILKKILNSGLKIYSKAPLQVNTIIEGCMAGGCGTFGATNLLSNIKNSKEYRLNFPTRNFDKPNFQPFNCNIYSFYDNNVIEYYEYDKNIKYKGEFILNKGENLDIFLSNELRELSNISFKSKYPISIINAAGFGQDYSIKHNRLYILYPNNLLGKEYILLPFKYTDLPQYTTNYLYKIVPLEDSTEIYINGVNRGIYGKYNYIEEYDDKPVYIKSNKKLSVMQYNDAKKVNRPGNADKRLNNQIQNLPLRQMLKKLNLAVFSDFDESSCRRGNKHTIYDKMFCNIIAHKDDDVFLDDAKIEGFTEVPGTEYKYKNHPVTRGYHKLEADKGVLGMINGHSPVYPGGDVEGFYNYHPDGNWKRDDADILVNKKFFEDTLCYYSPFTLSADAPEETQNYHWTINDTLEVEGKEVDLDLPLSGKYDIKLKLDDDENQVYEWSVVRLDKITSDLDSVIYLCNDSLTSLSVSVIGGGENKSITWFPDENIKDPTKYNIEFISPLKQSQKLYCEVKDENCCTYLDSIQIEIKNIYPKLSTNQNNFCIGDSATITLDRAYEQMVWNTGDTSQKIIVRDAGVYSATVTEGDCTNFASIEIFTNPLPEIEIKAPNGTIICEGGSVEIEIVVGNNVGVRWNDNSKIKKRTINQSGTYTVVATDIKTGCEKEVIIEIKDMGDFEAKIEGNPIFCEGESTTLTILPEAEQYHWNTGETSQSIVVNQSGIYSATLTSGMGCKAEASIEVSKESLPEFSILGEKEICENPVDLYPDSDFAKYEWSTGESTKTITVSEPGTYSLKVTNVNGCENTENIEVKAANQELNLSSRKVNFNEILYGNMSTQSINSDREVIIIKNTTQFNTDIENKTINIVFNPKNIGRFIDTLIVSTKGDCKVIDTIYIEGICKAEILASVSNSEGYPNDLVKNKVYLELQQKIPLPINFRYNITLKINADAIRINDNTTYTYENSKLVIDLADYLNKSEYTSEIKEIQSRLMLAKNHENAVAITSFSTDNDYLLPLRKDGNIKIYEVCLDQLRLIDSYAAAEIQQITKTRLTLSVKEEGTYKVEISDLTGKLLYKSAKNTIGLIEFNYELSNGTYLIKITEPGKVQTIKVIFME